MANGYMMALGDYRFSLDTAPYQELERNITYRWVEMRRLVRRPAMQFVGQGSETLSLKGLIYPHFRGGLGQVDRMRAEAGKGVPLDLTTGYGARWGRWVILQIADVQTIFFKDGVPRKIEFKLDLHQYGEDFEQPGHLNRNLLGDTFEFVPPPIPTSITTPPFLGNPPVIGPGNLGELGPRLAQTGMPPQRAASLFQRIATAAAAIKTETDAARQMYQTVRWTVDQVRYGLASDPVGTIAQILQSANGEGPLRLQVLQTLLGAEMAGDAVLLGDALRLSNDVQYQIKNW